MPVDPPARADLEEQISQARADLGETVEQIIVGLDSRKQSALRLARRTAFVGLGVAAVAVPTFVIWRHRR